MRQSVPLVALALASLLFATPSAVSAAPVGVFASPQQLFSPANVVLTMHMAKRRLRSAVLAVDVRCDGGGRTRLSETLVAGRELAMRRNDSGRFAGLARARWPQGDGSVRAIYRVSGSVGKRGRTASGLLSASVTWFDATGRRTKQCRKRAMRWTATRDPGRLFAGATSQDEPVVLWRPPEASWVTLDFRWHSRRCSDESYRLPGSGLGPIVIEDGQLRESTTVWQPLEGGGNAFLRTTLVGTIGRVRGHGSYRGELTLTEPNGSVATCKSGRISWHVQTG
jgi:hypothetical protein